MEYEVNGLNLPEQGSGAVPPEQGTQEAQARTVEGSCQLLCEYLGSILRDAGSARLDLDQLSPPFRPLGEALSAFRAQAEELVCYAGRLSKGDLSQRVSCPGEFSEAFNAMAQQLQEREDRFMREVQRARRRTEIIEGYTDMLVELLDQRDEWLVVVDQETREIVHCNKRSRGGEYCETCQHRLPIQPKLLEWDGSERYRIWEEEAEDKGRCYRIISFPIEWEERPSCIHIVMDVTKEKMNARHLSDTIYQDVETGIRNRLFLEEFMGHVLQERQSVTLCYLDLEGVSDINTSYGRKVGDAYIQNFVEIVRKHFRSGDTFVRIQDDKFCLMLTGNVKHLIERKMDEILTIFQQNDDRVFCHQCNFHYSILEVDGESNTLPMDKLLQEASDAVNRKKRKQYRQRKALELDDW